MVTSIKTNTAALIALQQLNNTSRELDITQNRVSTGYKVAASKDDPSTFAVAQKQRADLDGYDAVDQSAQRGLNILDVSIKALETLSNLLIEMKSKAVQASNPAITPQSRLLIDTDYQAYVAQLATVIDSASFDNTNLINKNPVNPLTDDLIVITEPTASTAASIIIPAINIKAVTVSVLTNVLDVPAATAEVTALDGMLQAVNNALAALGGSSSRLESHSSFVKKLQDSLTVGIGFLVDADLTAESAKLKSVQIQQQLSTQSLQIANSRPQLILALFQDS
ncbi:MAG: flagellin [Alphaproteobacteria bacterium]|nr:flagellin [Alphaproteobacteria bacterium]